MFKKVALLTMTIIILCHAGHLYAQQQINNKPTNPSVVIYGKITDKATSKPIANAEVCFQAKGVFKKVFSDKKGDYRICFEASFWLRVGKIWLAAQEYRKEGKFLSIFPGSRIIKLNFELIDVTKPYLEIYSPKENEGIFTNPTIELRYQDYGSAINKASVRIFANDKEVTKYIKIINYRRAICVISEKDPLPEGVGTVFARISDFAGNVSNKTVSVTAISKVNYLIRLGKQALVKRDIVSAHSYFKDAVSIAPANPEANFYYAVTRLGVLPLREPVFNLLQDMGFTGPGGVPLTAAHLNPFNFTVSLPLGIEKFNLPVSFPNGQKFRKIIEDEFISEMEQSLSGLALVLRHKKFVSFIEIQNPVSGTERVEIDYADTAILKSIIYAVKSKFHEMLVRNIDCDFSQLSYLFSMGALTPEYLLKEYPDLFRVKEVPQSVESREALVLAIDNYLEAFDSLQAETDEQSDDFISISYIPEYRQQAMLFAQEIGDIKKSLLSQPGARFSLKFSQLINLGHFYINPLDFRRLLDADAVSYLLQGNFLPQIDYALDNFAKANINYQEYLPWDNYYGDIKKREIDFADVAIAKSGLESMRMATFSLLGYDLSADFQAIALGFLKEDSLRLEDILNAYPHLFYLVDKKKVALAKEALGNIIRGYEEAVNYLLNREDNNQSDDLLIPTDDFWANESKYRITLEGLNNMQKTLIDPDFKIAGDEFHINLGEFFVNYKDMRGFLPRFDEENEVISGSWPDVTFGGLLPDNPFLE